MLLDIHTHRNAAVPGECIFNVEPAWFEPVEGCYYSVGIHPWKVLEAGPEDWTSHLIRFRKLFPRLPLKRKR